MKYWFIFHNFNVQDGSEFDLKAKARGKFQLIGPLSPNKFVALSAVMRCESELFRRD